RPAAFLFRKLVWVTGDLRNRKVRPNAGKAAWVLEAAVVADASPTEIPRYFGPQRSTLPAQ
ncbi:MAG TPA: hypothetical protein VNH18_07405, partial [Bryobacteraceae bacterium]|nr:hypothetical protein [Bryobacteraceae bacterium]